MRAALAIALVAASALADGRFSRFCDRTAQGRSSRGLPCNGGPTGPTPPSTLLAFLYPGDGNTSACGCTAPTVYSGQTIAISRASSATCSKKGTATTGIANGDLVVCASDEWRVEPNTSGVLGVRFDGSATTNYCLRSQELDDAAWTATGTSVAAPTVTADYATAPDGTASADRVQFAACPTSGDQSVLQQTTTLAASGTHSVYARSTAGAGAQSLTICASATGSSVCTTCDTTEASWTRCGRTNTAAAAQTIWLGCNNDAAFTGAANTGAADVLLWGAQSEGRTYVTAYIPTTSSGATRATETAGATLAANVPVTGSFGATFQPLHGADPGSCGNDCGAPAVYVNSARIIYPGGASNAVLAYDGTNNPATGAGWTQYTPKRYSNSWGNADGFLLKNETDGNSATSSFTDAAWTGTALIFAGPGGFSVSGIYTQLCLDSTRTGCQE